MKRALRIFDSRPKENINIHLSACTLSVFFQAVIKLQKFETKVAFLLKHREVQRNSSVRGLVWRGTGNDGDMWDFFRTGARARCASRVAQHFLKRSIRSVVIRRNNNKQPRREPRLSDDHVNTESPLTFWRSAMRRTPGDVTSRSRDHSRARGAWSPPAAPSAPNNKHKLLVPTYQSGSSLGPKARPWAGRTPPAQRGAVCEGTPPAVSPRTCLLPLGSVPVRNKVGGKVVQTLRMNRSRPGPTRISFQLRNSESELPAVGLFQLIKTKDPHPVEAIKLKASPTGSQCRILSCCNLFII